MRQNSKPGKKQNLSNMKNVLKDGQNTHRTCQDWKMETMWPYKMEAAIPQKDGT